MRCFLLYSDLQNLWYLLHALNFCHLTKIRGVDLVPVVVRMVRASSTICARILLVDGDLKVMAITMSTHAVDQEITISSYLVE